MPDEQPDVEGTATEVPPQPDPPQLEPVPDNPDVAVSEPVVEGKQVEQPTVHILVQRPEGGNVEVDVMATGDVRVSEVETLIKLGLSKWRQKIGLPG